MKRIIVLTTGKTGSTSFARACNTLPGYEAARHESKKRVLTIGERVYFYRGEIEVDNRLAFFLGPLYNFYGEDKDTLFVHLIRDRDKVIDSFSKVYSYPNSIARAFTEGVFSLICRKNTLDRSLALGAFIEAQNSNIEFFLAQIPKERSITVDIDNKTDLVKFIGFATGTEYPSGEVILNFCRELDNRGSFRIKFPLLYTLKELFYRFF